LKLGEIYRSALEIGKDRDPRGRKRTEKELEQVGKQYRELSEKDKKYYDTERLRNPYSDTRVLYGDLEQVVQGILVGIDIEAGEILLADRLKGKGSKIDLVISHHPEGCALANLYQVMHMQADVLHKFGVPINVAEGILQERIKEVGRKLMPVNHLRTVDIARLLDIPLLCIHTPADNSVAHFLQQLMEEKEPDTVKEVVDIILEIPEYQKAAADGTPPAVLAGAPANRCGKIFVDMTGGTGGSKEAFEKLATTDIGTIVGMHIGEEHRKEAEKNHINVVIAGHISSDTLGMNLLLDKLMETEKLEVAACSGFYRIVR